MSDKQDKDPPIEPQTFNGGVSVVDFGDYRVSRGFSRRHPASCIHKNMVYDLQERRIWCKDCETNVEGFDAFKTIVESFNSAVKRLKRRQEEVFAAENHNLISIAAKIIDEAWRKKNMIPCCPHCDRGLAPEDFKHGIVHFVGKEFDNAIRKKLKKE